MAFPLPLRRSHIYIEEPGELTVKDGVWQAASSPSPLPHCPPGSNLSSLLLQKTRGMCARPVLCLHQNRMGPIPILHKRFPCLAVASCLWKQNFYTHRFMVFLCSVAMREFLRFHSRPRYIQGNLTKTYRVMVTHI